MKAVLSVIFALTISSCTTQKMWCDAPVDGTEKTMQVDNESDEVLYEVKSQLGKNGWKFYAQKLGEITLKNTRSELKYDATRGRYLLTHDWKWKRGAYGIGKHWSKITFTVVDTKTGKTCVDLYTEGVGPVRAASMLNNALEKNTIYPQPR